MKTLQTIFSILFILGCWFDSNAQHRCGSEQLQSEMTRLDLQFKKNLDNYVKSIPERVKKKANKVMTTVEIPVVVHLIDDPSTSADDVSDARVQEQMDILNAAFAQTNPDFGTTPPDWANVAAGNTGISFCLAQQDPDGNPTNGINRISGTINYTSTTTNTIEDTYKPNNFWDPTQYMNVWVGRILPPGTGGVAGYAYPPTPGTGPTPTEARDGIVVDVSFFGGIAQESGAVTIHEVGHYLGLIHLWGLTNTNNTCANADGISDTPEQTASTQSQTTIGCPTQATAPATCGVPHMYVNYMDYSNDLGCYTMFTEEQEALMCDILLQERSSLANSIGCDNPCPANSSFALNWAPDPPEEITLGSSLTLFAGSIPILSSPIYDWTIDGTSYTSTFTATHQFLNIGDNIPITVTVSNGDPNCDETLTAWIDVVCTASADFELESNTIVFNTSLDLAPLTPQPNTVYNWTITDDTGVVATYSGNNTDVFSHLFDTPGGYTVTLETVYTDLDPNFSCTETSSQVVLVIDPAENPEDFCSTGLDFSFAFLQNRLGVNRRIEHTATVVNTTNMPTSVLVEFPATNVTIEAENAAVSAAQSLIFTIPPNGVEIVTFNYGGTTNANAERVQLNANGVEEDKRVRIVSLSNAPLAVFAENFQEKSRDAALILPTSALGNRYFISSYVLNGDGNGFQGPSEFAIVAIEDCEVCFTLSRDSNPISNSSPATAIQANALTCRMLDAGDALQIRSDNDLSGSEVTSDCNFALFSGIEATIIFQDGDDSARGRDHLYEQMYPVDAWSCTYLTVPFEEQNPTTNTSADIYRIMAAYPATEIAINGITVSDGATPYQLNAGDYLEIRENRVHISLAGTFTEITGAVNLTFPTTGSLYIEGTNEISVTQYYYSPVGTSPQGDPSMLMLSPLTQFIQEATFTTAPPFDPPGAATPSINNFLNIVTLDDPDTNIQVLDNNTSTFIFLDPAWVTNVGFGGLRTIRIPLGTDTDPNTVQHYTVRSTNADIGFNAYAYGIEEWGTYAYSAGVCTTPPVFNEELEVCEGGCVELEATGGTGYAWSPSTGLNFDDIANPTACPLQDTEYTVTITDDLGCERTASTFVTVSTNCCDSTALSLDDIVSESCNGCNGSISVTPQGGEAPYTYLWMPGGETTPFVNQLCEGDYTVIVTDANGCSVSETFSTLCSCPYQIGNVEVEACPAGGDIFCVPLETTGFPVIDPDIIGLDFCMEYDPTLVQPTGNATLGNVVLSDPNVDFFLNDQIPGVVRVVIAYLPGAPVGTSFQQIADEVICIEFETLPGVPAGAQIDFVSCELRESFELGVEDECVDDGSAIFESGLNIDGQIIYWNDNTRPLRYDDANPTDYNQTNVYTGDLCDGSVPTTASVQPDLNGDFTYDTANGLTIQIERDIDNNDPSCIFEEPLIGGFDARATAQFSARDNTYLPPPYAVIAMDVNMDGVVSAGDATQILNRSVMNGLCEFPQTWNYPNPTELSKDWRFVTASMVTSDPDFTISSNFPFEDMSTGVPVGYSRDNVPQVPFCLDIDLLDPNACPLTDEIEIQSILLGDVTGNWDDVLDAPQFKLNTGLGDFIIDLSQAQTGSTGNTCQTVIPIYYNGTEPIMSIDLRMDYDESQIQVTNVERVNDATNMQMAWNAYKDERLFLASFANDFSGFSSSDALFHFTIEHNGPFGATELGLLKGYINDQKIPVQVISSGSVYCQITNVNEIPIESINVWPSPTENQVTIDYSSVSQDVYSIALYAIDGRQLKHIKVVPSGISTIDLSHLPAAVYLLRINDNLSYKIVKL